MTLKTENPTPISITRRLQIVFTISIVFLVFSLVAVFVSNQRLIGASKWVNQTNEVIISTENLFSSIKESESAQRGFILTNDSVFLQPYLGGYQRTLAIYNQLAQLTGKNKLEQSALQEIRSLIDQRYEQMDHVLDMMGGVGGVERARTLPNVLAEMERGRIIMANLRANIDQIKGEERRLLKMRLDEQAAFTRYTPVVVLIASLIAIFISVTAYFRIRADLLERIRKQAEDEASYNETKQRINNLEVVTKGIGAGDYSVRSGDEGTDELGRIAGALNNMAASLEHNFNELEHRNWLQTGAVQLGEAMRGQRQIRTISERLIRTIATYVNASVGALYLADDHEHLYLKGSYATGDAPAEIPSGTGIIGQAVKDKRTIVTDALPQNYLRISSATGAASPAYVIAIPLLAGDRAIAALELGLLHKPTERELELLRLNADPMVTGITAALSYERTQELLEETRSQAEELQAQHEELEQANAELELQTEKLQASEEELRVQQEELQQANAELEERSRLLEERNQEIVEKNYAVQKQAQELMQSGKYKSEFLANMSHELRTPLNSILLLSRLLSENNEGTLTADQVEYARVIQSSGHGLLSLIDEILDLSKIEAGKMDLEFSSVTIQEIVDDMRSLFKPMADEKKLAFVINIEDSLATELETDKQRLEQIVKNLLSNAMKFTREGSVTLAAYKSPGRDAICFSVTDTGIGIPEEKQRLIFEAFKQADGSTRRKYGGTGLGLSISRELAKLLGGDISVSSTPGIGSTFTLCLPLVRRAAAPQPDDDAASEPLEEPSVSELPSRTPAPEPNPYIATNIPESIPDDRASIAPQDKAILIVEDDVHFAKSLLEFTRSKGYKGIVSVRGDEGLALARQFKPTGILLDIQLPVMSGWQVMEALKKDPQTRHIPVHIMSSYAAKKESLLKGAVDFINKPVAFEQMQEIFGKLEHVLNRTHKKVLIVEENPQHAKALAFFLETFNINSDVRHNVKDTIEALKQEADCVILEMAAPDSKAYQMLEEVKRIPELENMPIIVFTGKSLSLAEEQRIRQYATSIVVKTAHSYRRILDEVSLFLHLMEEGRNGKTPASARKLVALNEVLKGRKVLVVDDDVRNIFSLTKTLEGVNMEVYTAVDGREAMAQLQQHPDIDVVLLDMMMPEMDGYETARKIRSNPAWKRLPVIAVTAKAMSGDRDKCIQAGASDYITKPVDMDQLLSLLRVWLYEGSQSFS